MKRLIGQCGVAVEYQGKMSHEQAALLCVAADLTYNQFDILCKWKVFADESFQSWAPLTRGFKRIAEGLPEILYLLGRYPGACMDPVEYLPRALDLCFQKLEFTEKMQDIIVCDKGDGFPEDGNRDYPVCALCVNFPQDPGCQKPENCHCLGLGRVPESNAAELKHLTNYYDRWDKVTRL